MGKIFCIGDIQGCLSPLKQLLTKIKYDPNQDQLWFTGDLVNRGPDSLSTLRFIKSLPNTISVLGNHDLALLAKAEAGIPLGPEDTFIDVINAPDKTELLNWLRTLPLIHHEPESGYTLTHAGIYPDWDLSTAQTLAKEVEIILREENYRSFLKNMFGNQPSAWKDSLRGWDRARFITNAFTRMRFCNKDGTLNLKAKGTIHNHPELIPWFMVPHRQTKEDKLVFGHWAALGGNFMVENIYPLDTGCAWGNCLTSFCLQTKEKVSIDCPSLLS